MSSKQIYQLRWRVLLLPSCKQVRGENSHLKQSSFRRRCESAPSPPRVKLLTLQHVVSKLIADG